MKNYICGGIIIGLLCACAEPQDIEAEQEMDTAVPDLTDPAVQEQIGTSYITNYYSNTPVEPLDPDILNEEIAYKIADYFVAEQLKTRGEIAGYKVGTFAKGQFDDGPVNGLSGPVTAVMFSDGIHDSGFSISVDCCNMSFVEADFGAVVASDAINTAQTDMEILAALKGFVPFIEMPDILHLPGMGSDVASASTNYDFSNAILGDLIETEASEEWIERLNTFTFTMVNETGELLAEGSIADAYEPLYRIRHMRNQLVKRGRPLKEGDILSLGNMGAIRPLKENDYFDPVQRPVFRGNIATVSYIGLDPAGPADVSVTIDRSGE